MAFVSAKRRELYREASLAARLRVTDQVFLDGRPDASRLFFGDVEAAKKATRCPDGFLPCALSDGILTFIDTVTLDTLSPKLRMTYLSSVVARIN